ncbi:MAG: hypothetical protein ACXV5Q_02130 [Frankiaceae bacterium]
MLEACGHAADHPWAAVLGTDGPTGRIDHPLVLTWFDLTEQAFPTFSRTHGKGLRSPLRGYDHEHNFRVAGAHTARRRSGAAECLGVACAEHDAHHAVVR